MKYLFTLLSLSLFIQACLSQDLAQVSKPDSSSISQMKANPELEVSLTCKIYQYLGYEDSSKTVTKILKYYPNDKLASIQYQGYQKTSQSIYANATYFFEYRDTLVTQGWSITREGDSTKTIFSYNASGQLVSKGHYYYSQGFESGVDNGLGTPEGCIVDEEELEKDGKWTTRSEIQYTYDPMGRKIEYYAPSIHFSDQNRYTWSYNAEGKVKEQRAYEDERLLWTKVFSYSDTAYQSVKTTYDWQGKPEPNFELVNTFVLDEQGRIIEESLKTAREGITERTTTEYNKEGRIAKTVRYEGSTFPEITHLYEYE